MPKHTTIPPASKQISAPSGNPYNPTFDGDAEREASLLAFAMVPDQDPDAVGDICGLPETAFEDATCRAAFRVIRDLFEVGEPTDLESAGMHAQIRGTFGVTATELAAVFNEPATINPAKTISFLRNRHTKRQLAPELANMLAGARNGMPAAEILRNMAAQVEAMDTGGGVPPLTLADLQHRRVELPPEREYLCRAADGTGGMPRGEVMAVSGEGGTGKSMFMMQLAVAMAGGPGFDPFIIDKHSKVAILNAEDSRGEMDRRFFHITGGEIPEGMLFASVKGILEPILAKRDGNAIRSEWFRWLDRTISNVPDLDLVVIDPFSKFYGLEENSNEDATAFISALEFLARKHEVGILFVNHVSKSAKGAELSSNSSRGGKALTDGARWCAAMGEIRPEDAARFGMEDARGIVEFRVVKSNYSAVTPGSLYFRRDLVTGVMTHLEPGRDRIADMARFLADSLSKSGEAYTFRELEKGNDARELMESIPGMVRRRDARAVVNRAVADGLLTDRSVATGKTRKTVFVPPGIAINAGHAERRTTPDKNECPPLFPNESNTITVDTPNAGHPKMSTEKSNDFNTITVDTVAPLKGGGGPCPPFTPPRGSGEDPEAGPGAPEPGPEPMDEPEPGPEPEDVPMPVRPIRLSTGKGRKARCGDCIHQQPGKNFCGFAGSIMAQHLACEFFGERPRR